MSSERETSALGQPVAELERQFLAFRDEHMPQIPNATARSLLRRLTGSTAQATSDSLNAWNVLQATSHVIGADIYGEYIWGLMAAVYVGSTTEFLILGARDRGTAPYYLDQLYQAAVFFLATTAMFESLPELFLAPSWATLAGTATAVGFLSLINLSTRFFNGQNAQRATNFLTGFLNGGSGSSFFVGLMVNLFANGQVNSILGAVLGVSIVAWAASSGIANLSDRAMPVIALALANMLYVATLGFYLAEDAQANLLGNDVNESVPPWTYAVSVVVAVIINLYLYATLGTSLYLAPTPARTEAEPTERSPLLVQQVSGLMESASEGDDHLRVIENGSGHQSA